MQGRDALDTMLRHLAGNEPELAIAEATARFESSADSYLLGLLSFSLFIGQRFEDAATTGPDTIEPARDELALLDDVDRDSAAFIRYLLAEGALGCARLRLGSEIVALSPELPADFLSDGTNPRRFLTVMEIMPVRPLGFTGQITEALAYGDATLAHSREPFPELLLEATMCLVRGNAAQMSPVRAIADRLERAMPEPTDYLSHGCYLLVAYGLVAYGLIATAEVARAARFVLIAGQTPGLEELSIIDRAPGLELLVSASAAEWAALALEHARADDRVIDLAENEIVLSRARIVQGFSNEQIGRELGVSIKTVEKHVSEVFRRWNVASRTGHGGSRLCERWSGLRGVRPQGVRPPAAMPLRITATSRSATRR